MSADVFVDTNVLIYAYDADAGEKHKTANYILTEDLSHDQIVAGIKIQDPLS